MRGKGAWDLHSFQLDVVLSQRPSLFRRELNFSFYHHYTSAEP
jgi:hypothetical protein